MSNVQMTGPLIVPLTGPFPLPGPLTGPLPLPGPSTGRKSKPKLVLDPNSIPTSAEYMTIADQVYTVPQLKSLCRHFKLPVSGTKPELFRHIALFLRQSFFAQRIQRYWRKHAYRVYVRLRGPARIRRQLCVNDTDFLSLDELAEVPFLQFISLQDVDDIIYGFDVKSLFNLVNGLKTRPAMNPYNRKPLPLTTQLARLLVFSRVFGETIELDLAPPEALAPAQGLGPAQGLAPAQGPAQAQVPFLLQVEQVFQDIDALGNYTDASWFTDLDWRLQCRFCVTLHDIWTNRLVLSPLVRREICPTRDPFRDVNTRDIFRVPFETLCIQNLDIITLFVRGGLSTSSRQLGASYVLCALTLVNTRAARALPWLYSAVI